MEREELRKIGKELSPPPTERDSSPLLNTGGRCTQYACARTAERGVYKPYNGPPAAVIFTARFGPITGGS